MVNGSCAVLHNAFIAWSRLSLDPEDHVVGYVNDVDVAVDYAVQQGYYPIYFVGWNEEIGWYGYSVPDDFMELHGYGRISVFEFDGVVG